MIDYKTEILAEAMKLGAAEDQLEFLAEKYNEAMQHFRECMQHILDITIKYEEQLHNATHIQISD